MRHKIRTAVVLPDMQVPYHDKRSLRAVEKMMSDHAHVITHYINLGDFMDLPMLSKFSRGMAGELENMNVEADFKEGRRILERHAKILRKKNKNVEMVLLEGNHEFRVQRYADEFPHLREILDVEKNLRLRELGIKWITCYQTGALYKLGNAVFHHGRFANKYHACKMVEYYGRNIFYGHTHDVQCYSKVFHGDGRTLVGQSLGCLCDYRQAYIKGNPTNWQQAFGVFHFMPDGNFTYQVVRIFKHRFVFHGRVYSG